MATPRETPIERPLSIDEGLRAVLAAIRHAAGAEPVARIERPRLKRAEVTLDETIPDDLVAVWAAIPIRPKTPLEAQLSPEGAVAATAHLGEQGYEEAAEGYVALCTTAEEGEYLCWANASSSPIKARRREEEGPVRGVRVVTIAFAEDAAARPLGRVQPLAAWLRDRHGLDDDAIAAVPADFASAFQIVVLEPPAPRIQHAKFGEGELLEDLGDRALVRFGDGRTRKLLKSSFT